MTSRWESVRPNHLPRWAEYPRHRPTCAPTATAMDETLPRHVESGYRSRSTNRVPSGDTSMATRREKPK